MRRIKGYGLYLKLIPALLLLAGFAAKGQVTAKKDWQHLDKEKDGVFGISANKAFANLLKEQTGVPVIVAVIDGGVDTAHQDLQGMLWSNPREIPGNGKDDDRNGYVDDIHGWNFLGSAKGSFQYDNFDMVRELRSELVRDPHSARALKLQGELDSKRSRMQVLAQETKNQVEALSAILKKLGRENPSENDFRQYRYENYSQQQMLLKVVGAFKQPQGFSAFREQLDNRYRNYSEQLDYWLNPGYDPRKDKSYKNPFHGNGDVQGSLAYHATHVAGIIGAKENSLGGKGVAKNVQLMVLRTIPSGDYLDLDLARAIRYAADNGASVINLSTGKVTVTNREEIDQAVKYAMEKQVLIVHACGNQGKKLESGYYPQAQYQDGNKAQGWIEVGASGSQDDESLFFAASNYGKAVVDVFAPGVEIYSSIPGNGYTHLSGTSMAAAVVSGMAAVIRSYYPELTAVQVRDVIVNSVQKVNHNVKTKEGRSIPFSEICSSGGIVNLFNALKIIKEIR